MSSASDKESGSSSITNNSDNDVFLLRRDNDTLRREIALLTNENDRSTSEIALLTSENDRLTSENDRLTIENEALRQNDGIDEESDEDESDEDSDEEEEDNRTREEMDAEEIEEYITDNPLVKVGGKTYDRRTVTEIEVGEGVTEIEEDTFESSKNLWSIKLPSTIKSLGNWSFYRCKSLNSIKLPASLITISFGAFAGSSLRTIIIPNTVTTLGQSVFNHCKFLTSVTLPNSISSIETGTFGECSSLETIVIPASVTNFGGWSFKDCSALRTINIPIAATVDANAFNGCTKLEAKSASHNMTIVEYFRDYYHERVKLRVSVLTCLKSINEARIRRGEEEVKRMKLNGGGGSSSSGEVNSVVNIQRQRIGEFQGVLAEKMITAEELWREILKFL